MTQLKQLEDIQDLEIKSLQEVVNETSQKHHYKRFFEIERNLIESGRATSLSAYLLYEYQFKYKSIPDLADILRVSYNSIYNLLDKMNIPKRNPKESLKGKHNKRYGKYHSEETKKQISKSKRWLNQYNKEVEQLKQDLTREYSTEKAMKLWEIWGNFTPRDREEFYNIIRKHDQKDFDIDFFDRFKDRNIW